MPRGGQDCPGMPYSKRRYFDGQHAEFSNESKEEPKQISQTPISDDRPEWVESWSVTASLDNSGIHKHLRHYFDRRGLPSTYRAKPALLPFIDDLQPRSRPSTSERAWAMRTSQSMPSFKSASSPDGTARTGSMMSSYSNKSSRWGFSGPEEIAARSEGSIHWETQRCLQFGPNKKIGEARYLGDPVGKASGKKIPWVWNHHISDDEDREFMNPSPRTWTGAGRRHIMACHSRNGREVLVDEAGAGCRRSPSGHRLPLPGGGPWVHHAA